MLINGTNLDDDGVSAPILQDTSADLTSTLNANWSLGDDDMFGGINDDIYNINSAGDTANELAGQGNDTVVSRLATYTLGANLENLTLDSFGFFGVPLATDGTGNTLDNVITGNSRANTLTGLDGDDTLTGSGGADTLIGGAGLDRLDGGTGSDSMEGGAGNDTYVVDSTLDTVTEGFGAGRDLVESSVTHTLSVFVEDLTLTGTTAIDGTGNGSGNAMVGNSANNVLDGLGGNDTMTGGSGNDTYLVGSIGDVVVEAAAGGKDTVEATVTYTLSAEVENLDQFGAVGVVNGTGNASNNTMTGNNSASLMRGLDGNDVFLASGGNDTIEGGNGADVLRGGSGVDLLRAADNVLSNDNAIDKFQFDTALNAVTNVDTIERAWFDAAGSEATDDEILLENSIFTALQATGGAATGTLDAADLFSGAGRIGSGQFDASGIYQDTSNGYLYYNPTDTVAGDSVLFAVVSTATAGGGTALSAGDFTLV